MTRHLIALTLAVALAGCSDDYPPARRGGALDSAMLVADGQPPATDGPAPTPDKNGSRADSEIGRAHV